MKNSRLFLKIFLNVILSLIFANGYSQIGVGTVDPKATLDVVGDADTAASADGIIAPRLTGDQLRAKTAYSSAQTGTLVYITSPDSAPSGVTVNVNAAGYYYFDGSVWQNLITKTDGDAWDVTDEDTTSQILREGDVGIGFSSDELPDSSLEVRSTIKIASTSGEGEIEQKLIFETHADARGGGMIWSNANDTNRNSFLGRSYRGGSAIFGFGYVSSLSGVNVVNLNMANEPEELKFFINDNTGNVSIGNEINPGTKLEVDGYVLLGSSDDSGDTSPVAGMIRYNSDLDRFEGYTSANGWVVLGSAY
ncbi:MAG: hypothetical protein HRT67_12535 [Flavobacteriaceae bacterium]|nr:hypothetical protein [Flavobacteriaceae bacterium]